MIISDGRRRTQPAASTQLNIAFDETTHTYTLDGVRVPSVSVILRSSGLTGDYSKIDPVVLERARARGVAVHAACESIDRGEPLLDVPAEIDGYVAGYRRFLADTKFEVIAVEEIVAHREYRYAGRYDVFGWLSGYRTMIDRKAVATIDLCATSVQLAAYSCARESMRPAEAVEQAAALHLRPNGEYVLHLTDLPSALNVWLCALKIHDHKRQHGRS